MQTGRLLTQPTIEPIVEASRMTETREEQAENQRANVNLITTADQTSNSQGLVFAQPAPSSPIFNFEKPRFHQHLLYEKHSRVLEKMGKKRHTNWLALSSMVLGILAVIPPFSFLFLPAMAALTMGAFALRKIKRAPWGYSGKWMATVGTIGGLLGSLFILYNLAIAAFTVGTSIFAIFAIPIVVNMVVAAWLLLSA